MAASGRTISPMVSKQSVRPFRFQAWGPRTSQPRQTRDEPIALVKMYGLKLERMGILKSAYQALVPEFPRWFSTSRADYRFLPLFLRYSAVFKIGVTRAKI